jgi:hypothetical protein
MAHPLFADIFSKPYTCSLLVTGFCTQKTKESYHHIYLEKSIFIKFWISEFGFWIGGIARPAQALAPRVALSTL